MQLLGKSSERRNLSSNRQQRCKDWASPWKGETTRPRGTRLAGIYSTTLIPPTPPPLPRSGGCQRGGTHKNSHSRILEKHNFSLKLGTVNNSKQNIIEMTKHELRCTSRCLGWHVVTTKKGRAKTFWKHEGSRNTEEYTWGDWTPKKKRRLTSYKDRLRWARCSEDVLDS